MEEVLQPQELEEPPRVQPWLRVPEERVGKELVEEVRPLARPPLLVLQPP